MVRKNPVPRRRQPRLRLEFGNEHDTTDYGTSRTCHGPTSRLCYIILLSVSCILAMRC